MTTAKLKDLSRAARLFHALSDETRLRILLELGEGEQCVCDLMDRLRLGQSRLSFHLKTLKEAGLVRDRPEGRWVYYALDDSAFADLDELVRTLKEREWPRSRSAKCCE
ncbi:ArsR/SmtB family transcription factor [Nitrospira sp. Kam-Ns4a]